MLFVEPAFLFLLLPAVLLTHSFSPLRWKNLLLLFSSLLFYAWGEGTYVAVMLGSIAGNHLLARGIHRSQPNSLASRRWLALGIAGNLLPLLYFKYAHFVLGSLDALLPQLGLPVTQVHLPIGISFFTFQAIALLVDVWRRTSAAPYSILQTGLYIALFPQLIAGPIVRYSQVAAELVERRVELHGFAEGVQRFTLGLAKKMLLANSAAVHADGILSLNPERLNAPLAWFAMLCYSLQIYFDFSAYSDMAIGLGRMLGFRFPENFRHPYVAQSVTEFWRRWHMSLSSWFRDYLYIPLGGNRGGVLGTYRNLLLVFVLCGFWHGASWNFLIWGLLHGSLLVVERMGLGRLLLRLPRVLRHAYTLLFVLFAWVFFRAETLPDAWGILSLLLGLQSGDGATYQLGEFVDVQTVLLLVFGVSASMPTLARTLAYLRGSQPGQGVPGPGWGEYVRQSLGLAALVVLLIASASLIAADSYNPFIYFRF